MNEINGQHITGGQSKAFLFPVDMLGKIDGEPIVACDRVILAGECQRMSDAEAQKAFAEASTYTITIGPKKMTKAMKKFLHVKKARFPRKYKKELKKHILSETGYRKVIFRTNSKNGVDMIDWDGEVYHD